MPMARVCGMRLYIRTQRSSLMLQDGIRLLHCLRGIAYFLAIEFPTYIMLPSTVYLQNVGWLVFYNQGKRCRHNQNFLPSEGQDVEPF